MTNYEQIILNLISFSLDIYTQLKEFYKSVYIDSNFDIKIFTTRRSYVIFEIFKEIFQHDDIKGYGQFFNSHSVCLLDKEYVNGKAVLLVDDIMINGRTIKNLVEYLLNTSMFLPGKVFIKVFAINENAKQFNINDESNYKVLQPNIVDEKTWRSYSTCLNEFVIISEKGYVSYINSYIIKGAKKGLFKKLVCNSSIVYDLPNKVYSSHNIQSKVIFISNDGKNDFYKNNIALKTFVELLNGLNMKPCLRLYSYAKGLYYSNSSDLVLIPYVFMPSISVKQLRELVDVVFSNLPIQELYIRDELVFSSNYVYNVYDNVLSLTNGSYEYIYMLLSHILGEYLLYSFQADSYIEKLNVNIEKQMPSDVAMHIHLKFSGVINSINIPKLSLRDINFSESEEDDCIDTFQKSIDEFKEKPISFENMTSIISDYLFRMRTVDQNRAEKGEERARGIRYEDIINIISQKDDCFIKTSEEKKVFLILAALINNWDSGDGSSVVRLFPYCDDDGNIENIIGASIINGEQIFMFPFMYNQANYDFRCFYDITKKDDFASLLDFAQAMDERTKTTHYTDTFNILRNGLPNDLKFAWNLLKPETGTKDHSELIVSYIRDTK